MPRDEQPHGDLQTISRHERSERRCFFSTDYGPNKILPIGDAVLTTWVDVHAERRAAPGVLSVSGRWTRDAVTLVLVIDVACLRRRFDDQI